MKRLSNEPPLPDPLGYFLTWSTYGTWLPGDERGWIEYRQGWKPPDPIRKLEAEARMTEDACILNTEQRRLVEKTIADHCRIRHWHLHAVNCRTNHLHVVVTAEVPPKRIQIQFKAWCTRRLKEWERAHRRSPHDHRPLREHWWAERGSRRYINDEDSLLEAILYVRDYQDHPHHYY
jgi:REP element-mobilizing transposase RayT